MGITVSVPGKQLSVIDRESWDIERVSSEETSPPALSMRGGVVHSEKDPRDDAWTLG